MSKSLWELIIPAIAVGFSLIRVANKKKAHEKARNMEIGSEPSARTAKTRPESGGRVIYEGFLKQMYPRAVEIIPFSDEPSVETNVAEPAITVATPAKINANPNKDIFPEVGFGEGSMKDKAEKERPTAPLVEFNNPTAILQGIIFSEALAQPKAKNKFRYR